MDASRPKRGLSALLATTAQNNPSSAPNNAPAAVLANAVSTLDLPLTALRANPAQPRTNFDPDALAELAASIKARGLIQPVVARQLRADEVSGEQKYEIIAGERRWRASQMAGLTAIPVVVKQVFEPRDILLLSLVENLQRDDLNPLEEALAYKRLAATFDLTHEQIADGVGKSRTAVTNAMRLLELPSSIQDAVKLKRLSVGHAKVLLSIPDPTIQSQLAAKCQAEQLSVKELERLILGDALTKPKAGVPQTSKRTTAAKTNRVVPPNVQEVEQRLREHFGTKVQVEESLRKGRIIIEFYSVEDFERILDVMDINS